MTGTSGTNDSKHVLVVGASGLIGAIVARCFASAGHRVLGTYNSHPRDGLTRLNISDQEQTMSTVRAFRPSLVVHAGAMANVDLCEIERESCYKVNVMGTQNLIESAAAIGAKLIYFSSDYIFDGRSGPYSENDIPNPLNFYGVCKLEGERMIQKQLGDFLIARTTVVYGWERQGKNFVMSVISNLRRGEMMRIPSDQVGTPTYADNIAQALLDLFRTGQTGVFNIAGPELMDRHTLANLVAETFDLRKELLIPISTADLGQKAARPLKAGIRIDKLRSVSSVRMLPPREALRLMKESPQGSL